MQLRRIVTIFPIHNTGTAISYIVASIIDQMVQQGQQAILHVPASDKIAMRSFIRNAVPRSLKGIGYRLAGRDGLLKHTERRFLSSLRKDDIAYVWPGVSSGFCRRVKELGATLLIERINCLTRFARKHIEDDAAAINFQGDIHGITDTIIRQEDEDLREADYVYSPAPMVDQSLRLHGIPEHRILKGYYGWGSERIRPAASLEKPNLSTDHLRVLFVGTICFRKGIHHLLNAWQRAELKGELILAGGFAGDLPANTLLAMKGANVKILGQVNDIGSVYSSADVFAFPSLEEGSPLVTSEAMASGLPIVVSPMGAGRIAKEGEGAIILQPQDTEGWISALRRLAADAALRIEMGRAAAHRAKSFDWKHCAADRISQLQHAGFLISR